MEGPAMARRLALAFERFDRAELRFCRYLNRSSHSTAIRQLFRAVSWLGDGWVWYALLVALPLAVRRAQAVSPLCTSERRPPSA